LTHQIGICCCNAQQILPLTAAQFCESIGTDDLDEVMKWRTKAGLDIGATFL
jgi:hypothetical protein